MKSFYKKTLVLFLLLAATFVNVKQAYASECNASSFPEKNMFLNSYTKIINTTTLWGNKLVKFLTIEVSMEVY